MKTQVNFCLIVLLFCLEAYAGTTVGPRRGFVIEPTVPGPTATALSSGNTTEITGRLCFARMQGSLDEYKCSKTKLEGFKVRAFFPDALTEVTEKLVLQDWANAKPKGEKEAGNGKGKEGGPEQGHDEKTDWQSYSFTSPILKADGPNTFILLVEMENGKDTAAHRLMQVQAKLAKRMVLIQRRANQLREKGNFNLAEALKQTLSIFSKLTSRIDSAIAKKPAIAARLTYPLQVDNLVSGPFHLSSLFDRYRLSLDTVLGSLIEGEATSLMASVENLGKNVPWPHGGEEEANASEDSDRKFRLEVFWQEQKVHEGQSMSLALDVPYVFSFNSGRMETSQANGFKLRLLKMEPGDDRPTPWGSIVGQVPVSADEVAPKWVSEIWETQELYGQTLPLIKAEVADDFGRIDPSSFAFQMSGTLFDSTSFDKNIALVLEKQLEGQSYRISGDLNPLAEGHYLVKVAAKDFALNEAVPSPLIGEFYIDRTAPKLSLNEKGNRFTNISSLNLSLSVTDWIPTNTKVFHNNERVLETDQTQVMMQLQLIEGNNTINVMSMDSAKNQGQVVAEGLVLDTISPELSVSAPESLYTNQQNFALNISVKDANPDIVEVYHQGALVHVGNQSQFTFNGQLALGGNTWIVLAKDKAGNRSSEFKVENVVYDVTPPQIALGTSGAVSTNNPNFSTVYSIVEDKSPILTEFFVNGTPVFSTQEPLGTFQTTLHEGLQLIEVRCRDMAGNIAPVQYISLSLDTIVPELAINSPVAGEAITSESFIVSGAASEPISALRLNGAPVILASNLKDFAKTYSVSKEGPVTLTFEYSDLVGNVGSKTLEFEIVLRILRPELVRIEPNASATKLMIIGAAGAVKGALPVSAKAGFFHSASTTANSDGSFLLELDPFSQIVLTVYDDANDKEESATLSYAVDTTLAGVVRDIDDNPLPGVTVSIPSSQQSAVTDAAGTFRIANPVTGDQLVVLDGTTIPVDVSGPNKKYAKTAINVSIGVLQRNVLERVIYMSPLIFDGTETRVVDRAAASVSSPHAEGVALEIPAGAINFPDGGGSGDVSLAEVSSERVTVPPPEFAVPKTVIALEPSGTVFSEPVKLTLPNVNEFPAGMDLVIMSKNSQTGSWEIDGVAQVSVDGQNITTKEGMGITHFSEVFAAPLGPEITEWGGADRPGANTFDGALSVNVGMPSFKSLGQDIAPGLIYKSSWASPSVIVSNVFDVPKNEVVRDSQKRIVRKEYTADVDTTSISWIEPDKIEANFYTEGVNSGPMIFTGAPRKAVVSYAFDLSHLDSGVYPYLATYKIHLKQMVISTGRITAKVNPGYVFAGGATTLIQNQSVNRTFLQQVFPPDMAGPINVQNKINSTAGRGWKIIGAQKILNPGNNRVLIEEPSGEISTYLLNNSIATVYQAGNQAVRFLGFSEDDRAWLARNDEFIDEIELLSGKSSNVGQAPKLGGRVAWNKARRITGTTYTCDQWDQAIEFPNNFFQALKVNEGNLLLSGLANIRSVGSSGHSVIAGAYVDIPTVNGWTYSNPCYYGLINDSLAWPTVNACGPNENFASNGSWNTLSTSYCRSEFLRRSTGRRPYQGFRDGAVSSTNRPAFNWPAGITKSVDNSLIVADEGNNRVRKINFATMEVSTIAGNGQTRDDGDGLVATEASIYHPTAVAYDKLGNLYISTENGYIRRIDTSGKISTFAGRPLAQGGQLSDRTNKEQMVFRNPNGMFVDDENGYLYLADTGNHRVVRISFADGMAETFAGNGSCDESLAAKDNVPALESSLCEPFFVAPDQTGNLYIADQYLKKIRKVIVNNDVTSPLAFSPLHKDNSVLKRNRDGRWVREYRNGEIVEFDADGLQTRATDRVGREITFNYDGEGRLISQVDPVGSAISYHYLNGKLIRIEDPANRSTNFRYEEDLLTQIDFPDGSARTFFYDSNGLMIQEVNQRNVPTDYVFNARKRLVEVKKADGTSIKLQDSSSTTAGNDYVSGQRGQMKQLEGPDQPVDGVKDAKGTETTFNKDLNGFVSRIMDGEGRETRVERDLDGRPTKIIRSDGSYVSFFYNPETYDLIRKFDSATGSDIYFKYDPYGNILEQKNARGLVATNVYNDVNGLLYQSIDPLGRAITRSYSSLGLLASITDALGNSSSRVYDELGNLTSTTDAQGNTTSLERDGAGNIVKITNAKGQVRTREYDSFNRLIAVVSPIGERTEYSYLPTGELSTIKDPLGHFVTYEYDLLGRLVQKTDQVGNITKLMYDGNGNLIQEIDSNGNVKAFVYDKLDQLKEKILPDDHYMLSYDVRGNVTEISNKNSRITYDYEHTESGDLVKMASIQGLGELQNYPSQSMEYAYDANGNRIGMHTSVGEFQYDYDEADRLQRLVNAKGEVFSFTYDAGNRLRRIDRPGSNTLLNFDTTGFLERLVHSNGTTALRSFTYQRDSIGNRIGISTEAGNHVFSYDANNQLISATNPEVTDTYQSEAFSYDKVGNRITDQLGNFFYDSKRQRLQEDHSYVYLYDKKGNLISKQEKGLTGKIYNYTYSSENQLIQYEEYHGTLLKRAKYFYDAIGRRMEKRVEDLENSARSLVHKFAYDGQEVMIVFDGSNQVLASYTHSTLSTDDVLSVDVTPEGVSGGIAREAGSYFYLKDGIGTVRDIVTATGTKVQHYAYSTYGKLLKVEDVNGNDISANPVVDPYFTFTGREFDKETRLYYYRARYYDPNSGRFLQQDPDAGSLSAPSSFNSKYSYVTNNPMNFIDPSGAISFKVGGVSFNASFKSVVAAGICSPAALAKLVLHGQDSARLDNIVIAAAVITVAAVISPELAVVAVAGSLFKNRGTGGNFFDTSLEQHTTDFAVSFGIAYGLTYVSPFFKVPESALSVGKAAISGMSLTYVRETLKRSPIERRATAYWLSFAAVGPLAPLLVPYVEPNI